MDLGNGNWFAPSIGYGVNELGAFNSDIKEPDSQNQLNLDFGNSEYSSLYDNLPQNTGADFANAMGGSDAFGNWDSNPFVGLGYNEGSYFGSPSLYDASFFTPSSDFSGTEVNLGAAANPIAGSEFTGDKGEGNELLRRYRDAVKPLQPFLRNPIISTLMSLNPITAIAKTALQGPQSAGGFLGSLFGSTPLGKLAGSFVGSQLANYGTEGRFAPITGQQIGSTAGGLFGSLASPYTGGLGALIGGTIGANSGSNPYRLDTGLMPGELGGMPVVRDPNMLSTGLNSGFLGAFGNGMMAYNTNKTLNNQINTLEGLFGQNSSYAQNLRQQLERRDAAAGRRSQYGPREVELQAALAQQAAKLQPGLQQLYTQKNNNTNLLVQSLLRNPKLLSDLKDGWQGIAGMFQSSPNTITFDDPFVGGGFQSGNTGMGD